MSDGDGVSLHELLGDSVFSGDIDFDSVCDPVFERDWKREILFVVDRVSDLEWLDEWVGVPPDGDDVIVTSTDREWLAVRVGLEKDLVIEPSFVELAVYDRGAVAVLLVVASIVGV